MFLRFIILWKNINLLVVILNIVSFLSFTFHRPTLSSWSYRNWCFWMLIGVVDRYVSNLCQRVCSRTFRIFVRYNINILCQWYNKITVSNHRSSVNQGRVFQTNNTNFFSNFERAQYLNRTRRKIFYLVYQDIPTGKACCQSK